MAEPVKEMDPYTPGAATSEGKLTKWLTILGAVLAAGGPFLVMLSERYPNSIWLSLGVTLIGAVLAWLAQKGYVQSRTALKVSDLQLSASSTKTTAPPSP